MANVRDFRTRIRSVRSTQQITRAMKLVSAAKLRRAQERIVGARPYAHKMQDVLASLARRASPDLHPLLAVRPEERVLVVVVSADKGLCGSFNTNILNRARDVIRDASGSQVRADLIGRKAREWFKRRDYNVRSVRVDFGRTLSPESAREIAEDLMRLFTAGEVDAVDVIYNEFKSAIQQRIVVERLLPIPRTALFAAPAADPETGTAAGGRGAPDDGAGASAEDYIYEPQAATLLEALLPRHVEIQVYRILLESAAAEQGARMAAMENATRNAGEMIDSLTLQMNKIRQASITKEILEVVSGAEALR
jgi:F-type H+-transporting ATPase subunit gamma